MIVAADPDQDEAEHDDRQADGTDQHGAQRSATIRFHLFMFRAHRIRALPALGHRHPGGGSAKATFAHILQCGRFGLRAAFFGAGAI
jgi:hypothetical protein